MTAHLFRNVRRNPCKTPARDTSARRRPRCQVPGRLNFSQVILSISMTMCPSKAWGWDERIAMEYGKISREMDGTAAEGSGQEERAGLTTPDKVIGFDRKGQHELQLRENLWARNTTVDYSIATLNFWDDKGKNVHTPERVTFLGPFDTREILLRHGQHRILWQDKYSLRVEGGQSYLFQPPMVRRVFKV